MEIVAQQVEHFTVDEVCASSSLVNLPGVRGMFRNSLKKEHKYV